MAVSDRAIAQALHVFYDAGFRGLSLVQAVAIAIRESGLNPTARCYNVRDPATGKVTCYKSPDGGPPPPGVHVLSIDRGWMQFNSVAHAEVTDAMADDPATAAREAFRVSARGTNFGAWVAYTTGAFRDALARVGRLAGVDPSGALPPIGQKFAYSDPTGTTGDTGARPPAAPAGWGQLLPGELGLFGDFLSGVAGLGGGILSGITSKARKEIIAAATRLTVTGGLLFGGVALVVIGAHRAVQPAIQRTQDRAAEAAGTVAKVAAVT